MRKLAVVFATLICTSVYATVVVNETIEEMAQKSPVIVRGNVLDTAQAWDANHRSIWTTSRVEVLESIKGEAKGTIDVRQPGGQVGDVRVEVAGAAQLAKGEEVVLFLEPMKRETNAYVVRSMAAGKVRLPPPGVDAEAIRRIEDVDFASPGGRKAAAPPTPASNLGSREAFLQRVRLAAGKPAGK